MRTEYAWFLPTVRAGDGHKINVKTPERPPTVEYLSEVARVAEKAGFINLLVPTGTHCLDAWVMAGAVAQHTEKIRFCVAFRPGLTSPTFAAQTANTVDKIPDLLNSIAYVDKTMYSVVSDSDDSMPGSAFLYTP